MFVVWGGLHGLYLSAERLIRKLAGDFKPGPVLKLALAFVTFQLVCVAWLFFRAPDIGRAWVVLQAMVGINREHSAAFSRWDVTVAGLCLLGLLALHWRWRDLTLEDISRRVGWPVTAAVCGLMLFVVLTAKDVREQFIYFQF
jgi:alginate O-acetyltransferase complex protein AlgI